MFNNNTSIVNMLVDYANKNDIVFDIIENPLRLAIKYKNINAIQILLNYIELHNINLDINHCIMPAIYSNDPNMVKIVMDYAICHNIILDINSKCPILEAVVNINNLGIAKLLILLNYAINYDKQLTLNEAKLQEEIEFTAKCDSFEKKILRENCINSFSEIDINLILLLKLNWTNHHLKIEFCENSQLLKKFNDITFI